MVAHIFKLKLHLLRNSLRRSTPQLIGVILGGIYALGVLGAALVGLIALRFAAPGDVARNAIVVGGSLATLGWAVVPVIAFGVDQTLDPARFATFAIPRRQLVVGLLVSSLVGVPAAVTAILGLATVITWSHSVLAVLVGLVAAVVAVLTCVALSRVTSTAFSAVSGSRKVKETVSALGMLAAVGAWLASQTLTRRLSEPGIFSDIADVLGWTPLGWAWSAPADIVDGKVGSGLLRLALAVAFLLVVVMAWERLLRGALENPKGPSGRRSTIRESGLGLLGRLPGTPTGAVAARAITYWRRDPRYAISAAGLLMFPFIALLPSATGDRGMSLAMAPFAGYLLGWSMHNDVAYDGTSFWTHVATGVSGRADRVGRLMPTAALALVLLPLYATLGCALTDRWVLWPAVFGMGLGFLLAGFGVASVISAVKPYPVPGPGDNPFGSPPGAATLTIVVQLVAGATTLALNLPVLIFGIWASQDHNWMGWLSLGLAVVLGSATAIFGTRWGARIYERRAPELLAELSVIR